MLYMHLKVSTLSHITTSDRTTFLHQALWAEDMESCSLQRYKWPATVVLLSKEKELWRLALKLVFASCVVNQIAVNLVTNTCLSIADLYL